MHFLYIDEAGSTGFDLTAVQQPVFVMAGLTVSDEKWRKTSQAIRDKLETYFAGTAILTDFELHACELLSPSGGGPFAGHDRERRNALAIDLLRLIAERGHYLFHVPIYKAKLLATVAPSKNWGFNWHHPWQFGFSMQITMFEEFLRGPATGSTGTGLAIVDHEDESVEFVRMHTASRQADTGWKQLKKVVEIGYSASSHANPLIQLTDLAAFTLKKYYELETAAADKWPQPAKEFFQACRDAMWPRVKFKNPSFKKLNVHESMLETARTVRKP
jgi:hypothetical protein